MQTNDAVHAPGPIASSDRFIAIDAVRGFALLGILFVNMQTFAEPFGAFLVPETAGGIEKFWYVFVKIFCEGKFYVLFSMLFGMGLVLQQRSVDRAGGSFAGLYLRRLLVLLVIGLLHALVLWYGDILFVYAIVGTLLLVCSRARASTLLIVGAVVMALVILLGGLAGGLMMAQPRPETPTAIDLPAVESPMRALFAAYQDGKIQGGPEHPVYMHYETLAFREGPWLDAAFFRAATWLFFLVFTLLGFGWSIIAMFFIGAGLIKLDVLAPKWRAWRMRFVIAGVAVGVPCAIAAAVLMGSNGGFLAGAAGLTLNYIASPLFALMFFSAGSLIVESGRLRGVVSVLASVGRMALTNYLLQTVVCVSIFQHWGLQQFGLWTRNERCLLVLAIFAAQCVYSPIWLKYFKFGPMEWVWRSLTYLKVQPMVRAHAALPA